jgi:hypothetical protein
MVRDLCFASSSGAGDGATGPIPSTSAEDPEAMDVDGGEEQAAGLTSRLLTCGVDKTIKLWAANGPGGPGEQPLQTYLGRTGFK